jgi:hypothetical protein
LVVEALKQSGLLRRLLRCDGGRIPSANRDLFWLSLLNGNFPAV